MKYWTGQYLYDGFDVLFDQPVYLKQSKIYEIVSRITGSRSCYGEKGKTSVECGGVVFSFSDSDAAESNGTSVTDGQFPRRSAFSDNLSLFPPCLRGMCCMTVFSTRPSCGCVLELS